MANRTEYEMLWKLGAQLGKDFNSTFSSARSILTATQKEIQALNKQQSDIAGYTRQQQSIEKSNQKLETYQKQLENVQKEIAQTESYNSSLANKEVELQAKIKSIEEEIAAKTSKLNQMGAALSESGVDVKNLSDESARLEKELGELRDAEEKAGKEAESFGDKGADAFTAIGDAIVAAGIATALKAIYDGYKECISLSSDFEERMSTVEALSGASDSEMKQLSALAKELGATTKFTAIESGEAMTYMGMAGWNAQQMMAGMDGVLQLAAASGEDLGTVSDIVTDDLTAFGLAASDAGHFADILAAAATNSNTNVGLMGETFKYVAPLFGTMKWSAEDAAVAVGLMANAGIKGTQAGTSLKTALANLIAPTTKMQAVMDELDISITKADGSAMDFGEIMVMLRDRFAGLSEQEQAAAASAIFGKEAMSGMLNIINASEADFDKLTNSIENCAGSAKRMAEIKLDNLNGQITLMNSASDALKTTIGEAFNPELRALAAIGTEILTQINAFAAEHPVILKSIIAITAEVGGFLVVYKSYTAIKATLNTLSALSATLKAKEAAATAAQTAATTAQTGATVAATTAQTGLNAAMAANPIGLVLAGVAALTVSIIALTEASKKEKEASDELTAASQKQYNQIQALKAEYDAVCEKYGETSYQAQELSWQIADLTEQYEASKQTLSEYAQMCEDVKNAHDEMVTKHQEEISNLEKEGAGVISLVGRLESLTSQSSVTAGEQQEILAIVKALNSEVPGLSLSYNSLTNSLSSSTDAIMAMAKAQIAAEKYDTYLDQIVAKLKDNEQQEEKLTAATAQKAAAQERLEKLQKSYDKWYEKHKYGINSKKNAEKLGQYMAKIDQASKEVEKYSAEVDEANSAMQANESEIERMRSEMVALTDAISGTGKAASDASEESQSALDSALLAIGSGFMSAENAAALFGISSDALQTSLDEIQQYQESLNSAMELVESGFYSAEEAAKAYGVTVSDLEDYSSIQTTIEAINNLSESYIEVRDAAEKSIQGQYSLWDTAAVVIPTSIGTINTALETQLAYWDDYNTDLTNLLERADEIDGLNEVIASFADGSKESVNAIAGMANASDEDLKSMVANWKEVKEQQNKATESLAELATGYEQQMKDLKATLEEEVDGLNLEDEAAEAAKATIDAYTEAIRNSTDDAVKAAERLSALVATALKNPDILIKSETSETSTGQGSGSLSSVLGSSLGSWRNALMRSMQAYANGTDGAESGLALVGEEGPEIVAFRGGEKVFTAKETRVLMKEMNDETKLINAYAEGTGDDLVIVSMLPQLLEMMNALNAAGSAEKAAQEPIVSEAQKSVEIRIEVSPSFSIEGNADDEDIREKVRGWSDEIVEMVMDALEEKGIDTKRGVYA